MLDILYYTIVGNNANILYRIASLKGVYFMRIDINSSYGISDMLSMSDNMEVSESDFRKLKLSLL